MTEDDWTSQRKQTIYEESKRVMQGQKADIDDMDDKALRTVRLNAAILAIGATGIEISGIGEVKFNKYGDLFIEKIKNYVDENNLEGHVN